MVKKGAFIEALIVSVFIFLIGLMLGFFLENSRSNSLELALANSEISLIDEQLRGEVLGEFNASCDTTIRNTFDFADRIYSEAVKLENYDSASKFGNQLKVVHKRYDILRTILWMQSIALKERCSGKFHTVVYFYEYESLDVNTRAMQMTFERQLLELKNKYPEKILLIPIAVNSGVNSIDLIAEEKGIDKIPFILVDEKNKIRDLLEFSSLENVVLNTNK